MKLMKALRCSELTVRASCMLGVCHRTYLLCVHIGKPVIRFRKPKKKAKMGQTIATVGASAPASQRKPSAAAAARPTEKKKEVAAPANKTLLSFGEDDEA